MGCIRLTYIMPQGAEYEIFGDVEWADEIVNDLEVMRRTISSEIVITENWRELFELELSGNCYEIKVHAYLDDIVVWRGYINLKNGEWDLDACTYTTKVLPDDEYRCLLDSWEEQKNYLALNKVILNQESGVIVERVVPFDPNVTFTYDPRTPEPPIGGGWVISGYTAEIYSTAGETPNESAARRYIEHYWIREEWEGPSQPPSGWTFDTVNNVYYREAAIKSCETTLEFINDRSIGVLEVWVEKKRCEGVKITNLDNGIEFKEVINYLHDCGNIVSNFFGFSPDGTAPINQAYTYANTYLQDIVVFNCSDIVLFNAANNASVVNDNQLAGATTWKEFYLGLKTLFNLKLWFDEVGSVWRLEHISYLSAKRMLDTTRIINSVRKYKYDTSKLPKYEFWHFHFLTGSKDFDDANVKYDNSCVDAGTTEDYKAERIVTNILHILGNENYVDDFEKLACHVLVATNAKNIIRSNGAITGQSLTNGPLAFANLIENLYMHDRQLKEGVMNYKDVTFVTEKAKRTQSIEVKLCCEDYFGKYDANDKVKTSLAWSYVTKSTYVDELLTLETKF